MSTLICLEAFHETRCSERRDTRGARKGSQIGVTIDDTGGYERYREEGREEPE